jgi:hypothetical protein
VSQRIASTSFVLLLALSHVLPARADLVTDWNAIAVQSGKAAGASANVAPRALAILHLSIHDTLALLERSYATHLSAEALPTVPAQVSREAAVIGAAHYALVLLYPGQKASLDSLRNAAVAKLGALPGVNASVTFGANVADRVFQSRAADGFSLSKEYVNDLTPGKYRLTTTVKDAKAVEPHWADVLPIGFPAADVVALRPAAPPALDSAQYATDLAEVRRLGAKLSTDDTTLERNATQTDIAKFWEFATHIPVNAIARQIATSRKLTLVENARLFAQLNVALHNARVVVWNAKYFYAAWRPVTAITLGVPETTDAGLEADPEADAAWEPYLTTPLHPEYPSGHSITGSAGITVLKAWFGDEVSFSVDSDSLPDVTRTFARLSQAALENGKSRIYGGIHFQYANAAGQALGKTVGERALGLLPAVLAEPDPVEDAGIDSDAGNADAGVEPTDGGASVDAGTDAAVPPPPPAAKPDAGTPTGDEYEPDDRCAVHAAGSARNGISASGVLFAGLALWLSRRRRARSASVDTRVAG